MAKNKRINLNMLPYNKRFLISVSIILSVIIWFVAMIVRNPIREQTFADVSVKVSIDNTSAASLGLGIVSDVSSQKFTVTLSGPNYIVSSLKASDFLLSASVDEVNAPGSYSLSVSGSRNSNKKGYTFVSIEPSRINVSFDYIDTKVYDVVPKITGISAANGLVAENPIISNNEQSKITVKGPRSIVEKIDKVGSLIEVSEDKELSASKVYDSDIVLYDKNGDIIYRYDSAGNVYDDTDKKIENNFLSLSFTSVKVMQPISKKKNLNVSVNFSNLPSGFDKNNLDISVDHTNATVIGTPDIVDKMAGIKLPTIDWREVSASSENEFEVSANLPEGVRFFDNIEFFTVKLDLKNCAEKTVNISNIKFKGLSSDCVANSKSLKNVKICGPEEVIKNLNVSELYAEIDLTDKLSGEHAAEVTVKSSKYDNIWQVGNYTLSVTISDK